MSHKKVPHRHKNRFYNTIHERRQHVIMPSISMLIECYWNTRKRDYIDKDHWVVQSDATIALPQRSDQCFLTWIGHSTFLIQVQGITIITDPIFGHLPIFKRLLPPGMTPEQLPAIDYVLLSHNHRDHMDEAALTFFKKYDHIKFLVPMGDKAWFEHRGFRNVSEHTWWDQTNATRGFPLTFTFLPAHHWSQRGVFDYNKSLWGSWMITIGNKNIYFAGDTAYSSHFSAIAQEFSAISLALMPIGPCEPRRWMSYAHVSAEEAGQAFLDLRAHHFVAMHWGTFSFGTDPHAAPAERIKSWWLTQGIQEKKLSILKVGERIEVLQPQEQPIIVPAVENISEIVSP